MAADVTGDGKLDLAVVNKFSDTLCVFPGHGDGTFVSDSMPKWRLKRQRERLAEEWQRLVNEGRMLGHTEDELRGLLDEALKNSSPASKANGIIKP